MKNLNLLTPVLLLAALVASCAKEKEYEEVYKESVSSKAAMPCQDPNDPCIYVPSVGETPKDVTASRSYWMGEQKLVTFKFEEKKLIVEELPREDRFSGNRNNFSPVMEFDIEHKDFRCKEDQFGDCGNTEEEVDDKPWQTKKHVKIDFGSLDLVETNSLPEQLTNAFQGCYGAGKTVVKDVKIEKDAINIHIQKTWKADIECADLQTFADLRNMAFTVNYFYSFAKLSTVTSKDYKAVKYPFEDQNTFGYFTTDVMKLTADNRTTVDSKQTLINRWNPARKEVTYYLNDAFYKPGMESVLSSTQQAIATINNSFEHAGVDMKIKLEDGRGKSIGDVRNNFIILVDDPQASGVIGYGPSIANPRTGEIVKAQTVMYYGTIRKYIQDTYDELLEERTRAESAQANAEVAARMTVTAGEAIDATEQSRINTQRNVLSRFSQQMSTPRQVNASARNVNMSTVARNIKKEMFNPGRKVELSHWVNQLKNPQDLSDSQIAKAKLNIMSHQCFYHTSMVNWNDALGDSISAEALGIEALKPWNDLTDEEKDKVITVLMPNVWVPTLVHEFGHNLGLRHNFSGSEDKNNYYNANERSSLGIKREVTYSSVMDYAGTSLNQLPVMGKYDLAALSFGYNREVELKDGSKRVLSNNLTIEDLKKTGEDAQLKSFQYCTDEHVEVNPGCNRFDDGSGLKAIALDYVKNYKEKYAQRNFRNRRLNFDQYGGDVNYFFGVEYTFEGLRRFFEVYDRLTSMYPWSQTINWDDMIANAPTEEQREAMRSNKEFFVGLKEATEVALNFYLDVLTTPEVHCLVADTSTNKVAGIAPLAKIGSKDASSCYAEEVAENLREINPNFAATGQAGKFFNNMRFDETLPGELNADPSQISVRGIWMDKVLAVDYLTKRVLGITSFDDYRKNFMDYPGFAEKVQSTLTSFLTNNIEKEMEFALADGSTTKIPFVINVGDSHQIQRSLHSGLNRFLGINKVKTDFRELMVKTVKDSLNSNADEFEDRWAKYAMFNVTPAGLTTSINESLVVKKAEFKAENGTVVGRFYAQDSNLIAKELITQREERQSMEALDENLVQLAYVTIVAEIPVDQLPAAVATFYAAPIAALEGAIARLTGLNKTIAQAIVNIRKANPAAKAEDLPSALAPVLALGNEKITMFVDGGYLADDHLLRMMLIMSRN
jgi:hypothetical protein